MVEYLHSRILEFPVKYGWEILAPRYVRATSLFQKDKANKSRMFDPSKVGNLTRGAHTMTVQIRG